MFYLLIDGGPVKFDGNKFVFCNADERLEETREKLEALIDDQRERGLISEDYDNQILMVEVGYDMGKMIDSHEGTKYMWA